MTDRVPEMVIGIYGYCSEVGDTFGGVESHLTHLARSLTEAGWRVVVHCLSAPHGGWHVTEGEFRVGGRVREVSGVIEFVPVHGPGLSGAVEENIAVSRSYGERLLMVFGTRDGWVFDVAFDAADQLGVPVVSLVYFTAEERWFRSQFVSRTRSIAGIADAEEQHNLITQGMATLEAVLHRSRLVVTPTDYVRGQLAASVDPPVAAKIVTVYHGVDSRIFSDRGGSWAPGGAWLHVSRLSVPFAAHKNVISSCELLRALRDLDPVPRLDICGSGDATRLVDNFSEQNGLSERMTVTGFLPQADLAERMREASVLLVPSMMEAGCTVIVEAVLSGCLPVVLDHGGSGEIMRQLGLDDYLVTPEVRDLGSGVRTVVPSLGHAREIIESAYSDVGRTARALAVASAAARRRYELEVTNDLLRRHLDRRGLLDVPAPPRSVAPTEHVGGVGAGR